METYCGKQCEYCVDKAELNCPGCKAVSGSERQRDCEIAACCRSKEYASCASCNMSVGCGRQLGRNAVPARRKQKLAEAAAHREELIRRSDAVADRLIPLFWLVIPTVIAMVLTSDFVVGALPVILVPGMLLRAATAVVCAVILLKLSCEERGYLAAGLCSLGTAALSLAYLLIPSGHMGLAALCTAATLIVSLAGENREYTAHRRVLLELDENLGSKWRLLWKWYATAGLGTMLGLVVLVVAPLLGGTIVILCTAMTVVVGVKKLLYLRRTIIALREGPV